MFSTFYTSTQLQSLGAENNCILIKPQNKPIRAADLFLSSNFKVPSANVSNSKVYFSNHIKITPSIFFCSTLSMNDRVPKSHSSWSRIEASPPIFLGIILGPEHGIEFINCSIVRTWKRLERKAIMYYKTLSIRLPLGVWKSTCMTIDHWILEDKYREIH